MQILVLRTPEQLDRQAAGMMADAIRRRPDAVVGLSTGRTTGDIHRAFVRLVRETGLDCSQATFFGQDEVAGVPREYAGTCYTMLMNEIVGPLGIPEDRFLMLPVESDDFDRDCRAFVAELERRGGVDFVRQIDQLIGAVPGRGDDDHKAAALAPGLPDNFRRPAQPFPVGQRAPAEFLNQ